jgi:hypothetical protein
VKEFYLRIELGPAMTAERLAGLVALVAGSLASLHELIPQRRDVFADRGVIGDWEITRDPIPCDLCGAPAVMEHATFDVPGNRDEGTAIREYTQNLCAGCAQLGKF